MRKNGNSKITSVQDLDEIGFNQGATYDPEFYDEKKCSECHEQFFKLLTEFSDDWIYWINPDSTLVYNSPSCKYITGFDKSDEIFKDTFFLENMIDSNYLENLNKHNNRVEKRINVCYETFAILTKNRELRVIHHYCQAVYNKFGVYLGRYSRNKDVSEIQKYGMIIPFDEKIVQQMYDSTTSGYYQITLDGNIINANHKFLEILGYESVNDVKDLNIEEYSFVNSVDRKVFNGRLLKYGYVSEFESDWIKKDGSIINLKETASLVQDMYANNSFYHGIVEDITEKKQAERATRTAIVNQIKSENLKTEFLATISHEIRTPLNVILNFIQMLKVDLGSVLGSEKLETIDIMAEEGERIHRTIELILEMSQLQSNTYECEFNEFDLIEKLYNSLIISFTEKANKKHLELKFRKKLDVALIYADMQSVKQIFNQLIENSLKYTQHGSIEIEIYRNSRGQICVKIADTGIGINEEYIPHLFSLFSQEDNSYSRMFEGTGLGLALVKKHCDLNNASIEVKSKKNVGSEFIVTFLNEVKTT